MEVTPVERTAPVRVGPGSPLHEAPDLPNPMKATAILILLSVCAHAQGPLTPLGPPGPEMKSRQEIWAKAGDLETRIDQTRARISSAASENRLLAGLVSIPAANRPWLSTTVDPSGNNVGSSSSLAIGPDGHPAISYVDPTQLSLKIARFNGSTWLIETLDTAASLGIFDTSLAFGPDGHPAISYFDYNLQELRIVRFDGISWSTPIVVDTFGSVGFANSLAFDPDGQPAISYGYNNGSGDEGLKFARFDGTVWNIVIVDSSGGFVLASSLAFGTDGKAAVAYHDATADDLKFARNNGSSWELPTIVDSLGDVGNYASLAFGPSGHPAIAYQNTSLNDLMLATFDGLNWNKQTVDAFGILGEGASLAYGPDGQPAISYRNGFGPFLRYARHNGSSWIYETIHHGNISGVTSLVFGADGQPSVAYLDVSGGLSNGVLKFARRGIFKPAP